MGLRSDRGLAAVPAMRRRVGRGVGDPDVTVRAGPLDQTTRTLGNAVAIFEMRSDDTATTDRVAKLLDYAIVPSLRSYVLLNQTAMGAIRFHRAPGGPWTARAHTSGMLAPPGLDVPLPIEDLYRGLTLAA